ncbi:recombinase family protein [Nonomuraea sp. NPDC003214]
MLLFEDLATTSNISALERPAFARVAAAHPGDTLAVSELFRLCRDLVDIHAVRSWCQARGVVLRVMSRAVVEPCRNPSSPVASSHSDRAESADTPFSAVTGNDRRVGWAFQAAHARGRPPQRMPFSLRMRARSRRWAASTSG